MSPAAKVPVHKSSTNPVPDEKTVLITRDGHVAKGMFPAKKAKGKIESPLKTTALVSPQRKIII